MQLKPPLDTEQRDNEPETDLHHAEHGNSRLLILPSPTSTLMLSAYYCSRGNSLGSGCKLYFSFSTAGFRKILEKNKVITTIQRHLKKKKKKKKT